MCGIAGFVTDDRSMHADVGETSSILKRMCDVIRHRGPDDQGFLVADGAALGMRRLSIIDLSGGRQPIRNEDGSVWVVFNGEIYNYRELREQLTRLGHAFYTDTDTETIVHAYEEWGERAFDRLRGMFGIALWDRTSKTLLLARDRVGIKPLHYAVRGSRLWFGSEIKSILAGGEIEPALDPSALDHFLSFLYTPADQSVFEGIRKLPPGHLLRWHDGQASMERYWALPAAESFDGDEDEAVDAVEACVADAVRSHLVSDVPIGALLSGGIDSSLVVAMMARASSRPISTFSIGFDEPAYDELDGARRIADVFGTDHHEYVVRPQAVNILEDLVEHFDEPFADASAIPTWYVCQMARRHVTVVLSGDGGDELFGGYDRYLPHPRVEQFDRIAGQAGRTLARAVWPWLPHGVRGKNFLRHVSQDARGRYVDSVGFFQPDEKRALLAPELDRMIGQGHVRAFERRFDRFDGLSWPAQMMAVDFETYLPDDILTKVDRMSMAHSIESRVPLLDHELVSVAASLPAAMKIRGPERKRVLKRVAARVLPADVLTRPKRGFGIPLEVWFRGQLRDVCHDLLGSVRTRQRGYFQPHVVDRLLREHVEGRRDHTLRLWQLIVFELWHRKYLDQSPDAGNGGTPFPLTPDLLPNKDNPQTA